MLSAEQLVAADTEASLSLSSVIPVQVLGGTSQTCKVSLKFTQVV